MSEENLFVNATLDELVRGYMEAEEAFICICCGEKATKGIIYPEDGLLYEAGLYIRVHIEKRHGSVFDYLIGLGKSHTGLSDLQSGLLELLYRGRTDAEVQRALGIGSASTVRNHRFLLREKERQARVFLALMELLRARDKRDTAAAGKVGAANKHTRSAAAAAPHKEPGRVQDPAASRGRDESLAAGRDYGPDRASTRDLEPQSERERVLAKHFPEGVQGFLASFPRKQKDRRLVLDELVKRFRPGRPYTEKEVNTILSEAHDDHATLRRWLVDCGLMRRTDDGSRYWLPDNKPEKEDTAMNRREELKRIAAEVKTEAGVYQIRNTVNGKRFIDSTRNLKTLNGQLMQLDMGSHRNKTLQSEWKEYGKDGFVVEVLEVLKKRDTPYFDEKDELKQLRDRWREQLQPYGEQGYH